MDTAKALAKLRKAVRHIGSFEDAFQVRDDAIGALLRAGMAPEAVAAAAGLSMRRLSEIAAGHGMARPRGRPRKDRGEPRVLSGADSDGGERK